MADSEQKKPLTKNQEKNEAKRRAKMEKFLAKQKKQQVNISNKYTNIIICIFF